MKFDIPDDVFSSGSTKRNTRPTYIFHIKLKMIESKLPNNIKQTLKDSEDCKSEYVIEETIDLTKYKTPLMLNMMTDTEIEAYIGAVSLGLISECFEITYTNEGDYVD